MNGDLFGERGLNIGFGNGKASAWEVDTRDGIGAELDTSRLRYEDSVIRASSLPAGLTLLASGEADAGGPGAELVSTNTAAEASSFPSDH